MGGGAGLWHRCTGSSTMGRQRLRRASQHCHICTFPPWEIAPESLCVPPYLHNQDLQCRFFSTYRARNRMLYTCECSVWLSQENVGQGSPDILQRRLGSWFPQSWPWLISSLTPFLTDPPHDHLSASKALDLAPLFACIYPIVNNLLFPSHTCVFIQAAPSARSLCPIFFKGLTFTHSSELNPGIVANHPWVTMQAKCPLHSSTAGHTTFY